MVDDLDAGSEAVQGKESSVDKTWKGTIDRAYSLAAEYRGSGYPLSTRPYGIVVDGRTKAAHLIWESSEIGDNNGYEAQYDSRLNSTCVGSAEIAPDGSVEFYPQLTDTRGEPERYPPYRSGEIRKTMSVSEGGNLVIVDPNTGNQQDTFLIRLGRNYYRDALKRMPAYDLAVEGQRDLVEDKMAEYLDRSVSHTTDGLAAAEQAKSA